MAKTVYKGILKTWKDDRGFGFIQPEHDDKDIFVHISSLKGMARRPVRGDVLHYEVAKDAGGKSKAVNVRIEGVEMLKPAKKSNSLWLFIAALGLIAAAAVAYFSLSAPIQP
jgi:CspA family cold shock protein